jgi:hypothetical protein
MTSKHRVVALLIGAGLVVSAAPGRGDGAGPYQFHSLTPCRIVDTRSSAPTVGHYGPYLTSTGNTATDVARNFPVRGNCGVPPTAKAATLNVTAVNPTNTGRFTVYPSDITTPTVSTINFPAGTTALANGAIVPLSTTAVDCPAGYDISDCDLAVMPFVLHGGHVDLVLDITGYFE